MRPTEAIRLGNGIWAKLVWISARMVYRLISRTRSQMAPQVRAMMSSVPTGRKDFFMNRMGLVSCDVAFGMGGPASYGGLGKDNARRLL